MRDAARRVGAPGLGLTAVVVVLLGTQVPGVPELAILGAVVGLAISAGLRFAHAAVARELAVAPALAVLAVLAVAARPSLGIEALAGFGGVAAVVWVTDDPDRPPGGLERGLLGILIPALVVGIAWAGAELLPGGSLSFGIATALLAVVLAGVAVLLGRPDLIGREAPATSYAGRR